jgi:hypothetical protein
MPPKKTTTSAVTPTKTTKTGTSLARTVGPAIPLAIALLGSAVLPGGKTTAPSAPNGPITSTAPQKCAGDIADFRACHDTYPTGCTTSGSSYDPLLNELKNQIKWGTLSPAAMQPKVVISSLDQLNQLESAIQKIGLNQKNHGDATISGKLTALGEGSIYGVVGYLYAVEPEGAESSNCQLAKDPPDFQDVDYHIFIGFDPAVAEKLRSGKAITSAEKHQSMVVEMTPHYRDAFHQEWTVPAVKEVLGQQVKVLGQLMVDNEHFVAGQDCGVDPTNARCWRASVWELHPVIDFTSCQAGTCSATSSAGWTPIGENTKSASASEEAPAKSAKGNNQ